MSKEEDVRFEADGSMTVSGKTFKMLEELARDLGITPEEALRQGIAEASVREEV